MILLRFHIPLGTEYGTLKLENDDGTPYWSAARVCAFEALHPDLK